MKKSPLKSRAKPRKLPKSSLSTLKKKADKIFSVAVRLRDSNSSGVVPCITCSKPIPYTQVHAGHFQSRRYNATRWDRRNVNGQCAGCNTFNNGEQYKYGLAVDLKYGSGTAKELHDLAHAPFKLTRELLENVIREAKEEVDGYEKGA